MKLKINSDRIRSETPLSSIGWKVWKKKTNLFSFSQFGMADWTPNQQTDDLPALGNEIREAAKFEFGGRWYRAAGFGVVLRFPEISGDPLQILDNIDLRNRLDGNLWQWTVLVFEAERAVVGMHMWYHGYLHPVFLEVTSNFSDAGYDVITSDTKTDPLAAKLIKINNTLRPIKWLDSFLN